MQLLANEATQPLIMGIDALKAYIAAEVETYVRLGQEAGTQAE